MTTKLIDAVSRAVDWLWGVEPEKARTIERRLQELEQENAKLKKELETYRLGDDNDTEE